MSHTLFDYTATAGGVADSPYPPVRDNTLSLRPYQRDASDAIWRAWDEGCVAPLLILPTGAGKTTVFCSVAREECLRGGRVLMLAHRKELIQQMARTVNRVGVDPGIEMAGSYARAEFEPQVVVASVPTMQNKRLASWDRDAFTLIIVDESHHATAPTYRNIFAHFDRARILGVTATADRADEETLDVVFDTVAYEMTIYEAMTAPSPGPYLCRLKFAQCDLSIDLRALQPKGEDYSDEDLEAIIAPLVEVMANAVYQEIGDRHTIVFMPGCKSAQGMCSALNSLGKTAVYVDGAMKGSERDLAIQRFHKRDAQVLVNVGVATEGFDAPSVDCIVLGRPTKSRGLFSQQVGRGTRLYPGKDYCLVVDFDFLTAKHDLVRPVDLFDSSRRDAEAMSLAAEALDRKVKDEEEEEPVDLLDLMEWAEKEHKRRSLMRVQAKRQTVTYRKVVYDPLTVHDALGIAWRPPVVAKFEPATEKQVATLTKFGVQEAAGMSKKQAGRLLDALYARTRQKLATHKQVTWLIQKGVDPATARRMSFDDASAKLDELFNNRRAQ